MKSTWVAMAGVAALACLLFVTTNHAAVREMATEPPSIRGDLKVFADLVTSQDHQQSIQDQACAAIEFHSEYVVLKYKGTGGRLIPLGQIKSLHWDGK